MLNYSLSKTYHIILVRIIKTPLAKLVKAYKTISYVTKLGIIEGYWLNAVSQNITTCEYFISASEILN